MKPNPAWRGDPTFLPDVLKAFGVQTRILDGAFNRGHGDFGKIKGIIVHHIGANKYDAWNIARHSTLGLCSQIHLSREGVATICGVGIAWHAGRGSYSGWQTNNANYESIGIEAESDGVSPWPAKELDAYYRVCAAILWFLGKQATTQSLLSHWEYSLKAQGKWDPGAGNGKSGAMMDMNVFRQKVNQYINNPPFEKKAAPAPAPAVNDTKKEDSVAFDQIKRKYTSRVAGSKVTMRPIDALMNTDAHSFVARANTEKILKRLDELEKKVGK